MGKKTISDIFGENVFNDKKMKEYLSKDTYLKLRKSIDEGKELSLDIADEIADAMKNWAISMGATHYTHWFQPLTGMTAEKQDAFISAPDNAGEIIMEFSGKELVKGEPDASSFPSGGLRATFEARGYTAWDCTSPAFIREDACGPTLCIPTIFCSYTGESLDQKTPLLRSIDAINKESLRLLRNLGNTTSKKVTPMIGAEQEYFLIDKKAYIDRKDLTYTGRTLFGVMPPKGQELDDHYFGNIKARVGAFMKDVNKELWKLGIPAKTQHNEVAPSQHELAPVYTQCNIAADQNQLVMRILKNVAGKHNLKCILHEKPFLGVNGSGKHNNWSLVTDDGINLLSPGKHPHDNLQFLLILACILKAVDRHADLLRESAANIGNEHRLGADEAPPAIISVFLGDQLEDILKQYIEQGYADHSLKGGKLDSGVNVLPQVRMDATDRNRTSPFAFTGNKFEFRMVGSKDSIAEPNIVLNTIVAEAFSQASDFLEKADDKEKAVKELIGELATKHQRIIYSGNGYSQEWIEEAKRRGLLNLKSMVDAIPVLINEKSIELFEKFGVFTKTELQSRYEIQMSTYSKMTRIEAKAMVDIAAKIILPAVMEYETKVANGINLIEKAGAQATVQKKVLNKLSVCLSKAAQELEKLREVEQAADKLNIDCPETAVFYHEKVCPVMENLRKPIDELEMIVDKKAWPMPSYGDLLFGV